MSVAPSPLSMLERLGCLLKCPIVSPAPVGTARRASWSNEAKAYVDVDGKPVACLELEGFSIHLHPDGGSGVVDVLYGRSRAHLAEQVWAWEKIENVRRYLP